MSGSAFLFAACQVGVERWVKADIAREHGMRPAWSRPGITTFKSDVAITADVRLRTPFVRAWGPSIGAVKDLDALNAAIDARGLRGARLHVWEREPLPAKMINGRRGEPEIFGPFAEAARTAILEGCGGRLLEDEAASIGDAVVDVIVADGEPWWAGWHVHDANRPPWAGGRIPVDVPAEAPSRAYRKTEEALIWSGAPLRQGDRVLEFGCAPGGGSFALLKRGAEVFGVDPEPVADIVARNARFHHLRVAMGGVRREVLPEGVRWIAMDVGIAPQVALRGLQRFVPPYKRTLMGFLLTLQLNDDTVVADIPALLDRVRELGVASLRVTQLPSNRREVFVYARTDLER